MSRRLLDPALLEEIVDLLLAQPLDVEGAARHEMLQVLGPLERAGELARAAEAHALLARRIDLAHHRRLQRARACLRETRTPSRPSAASPARRRAPAGSRRRRAGSITVSPMRTSSRAISSALCRVAFCTITPPTRDRLELGDRRERAGAADLDLDVAQHASSPSRPGTCARPPSAGCARRSRAAPASRAGRPCRRRRRCRSRASPRFEPDLIVEGEQLLGRVAHACRSDWCGSRSLAEPLHHAGLGLGRHLAHLAPGIGEEAQRPRRGDAGILLPQRAGRGVARIDEELARRPRSAAC